MNDKPYRVLECASYKSINDALLDYIHKYTDIISNDPRLPTYDPVNNPVTYPNFPAKFGRDIVHFVKANPEMVKWLSSLGLLMRDAYFTLTWDIRCSNSDRSPCPLHLDKPPVYWKLNWPILNMENSAVRFFKLKDPNKDLQSMIIRGGDPNSKTHDHYFLDYDQFEEYDRYRFDQCKPIIMNGMVPHDVGFYQDPVFPRIGLQVMFIKEPMHLVQ